MEAIRHATGPTMLPTIRRELRLIKEEKDTCGHVYYYYECPGCGFQIIHHGYHTLDCELCGKLQEQIIIRDKIWKPMIDNAVDKIITVINKRIDQEAHTLLSQIKKDYNDFTMS